MAEHKTEMNTTEKLNSKHTKMFASCFDKVK